MEEIGLEDKQPTVIMAPGDTGSFPGRRQAALVQFPRRVLLWLLAFGGALLLIWGLFFIGGDDGLRQSPLLPRLGEGVRGTFSLLLLSFLFATALALPLTGGAIFQRRIQGEVGGAGLLLRFGSRLLMFALLSTPPIVLALLARWLLVAGVHSSASSALPSAMVEFGRFPLAALALAFLPALLAAQAATRRFTLLRTRSAAVTTLLALLAALLRQTGGILSAQVVVEIVFQRPGLGNLLLLSFVHNNAGLLPLILSLLALLVFAGLLLAELCEWSAQLLTTPRKPARQAIQRPAERRLWIGVAMWLLLIPLLLAAGGLLTEPEYSLREDMGERNELPSPEHPLGTDSLGRDMWARALHAGLSTARRSSGTAALSLIPAFFLGMIAGVLGGREQWQRETVADLLLFPLDALLFIPVIPGTMAILLFWDTLAGPALVLVPAILLAPRVAHATRSLWERRATDRRAGWDMLVGMSALFLGTLFISFGAMTALEYVGLGPRPPLPSLGTLLQVGQQIFLSNPQQFASIAAIVAGYSLAFFAAADALLDAFNTKQAMADLNR